HGSFKTFLNCRDKFSRNNTANNLVVKQQPWLAIFPWSKFKYDIGKFTFTTSLFLIDLFVLNTFRDRFFVCNLRCTLVDLNLKLTLQSVDDNLEVKFTHTSQDRLSCFLVSFYLQSWILFNKL